MNSSNAKQLKAGDRIATKNFQDRGFVMNNQEGVPEGRVRIMFENANAPELMRIADLERRASFSVLGSKTSPSDEDYSPAVVDEADTIEEALEKYKTVMDYPFAWIEYHDVNGDTWEFEPRKQV